MYLHYFRASSLYDPPGSRTQIFQLVMLTRQPIAIEDRFAMLLDRELVEISSSGIVLKLLLDLDIRRFQQILHIYRHHTPIYYKYLSDHSDL